MKFRFLKGDFCFSRTRIAVNEGGYVAGFTWLISARFFDAWIKIAFIEGRLTIS